MAEHEHDERCCSVEVRGVYDGVLWWACSDGVLRNRWRPIADANPADKVAAHRAQVADEMIAAAERAAWRVFGVEPPQRGPYVPHLHREHVPGCFRCELSADEVGAAGERGGDG